MKTIVLLGPQRLQPTLVQAVEAVGSEGPVAAVTAGWEEREEEISELRQHLDRRVLHLGIYARSEDVFRRDPEFFRAWQERRARMRELQLAHRDRLDHLMLALRGLRKQTGRPEILNPERRDALEDVRRLDAHHVQRVLELQREFDERWRPFERDAVARHRREIAAIADQCGSLAIAGGNVAVLLNRVRLFGLVDLFAEHTVFAWSAGAMAMTERIVLFHDDPPWGRGNPIILAPGFGLCRGIVALPHAHRRLRLDRPTRLRLWHERFEPLQCLAFDDGAWLIFRDGEPQVAAGGVRRFGHDGHLVEFVAA